MAISISARAHCRKHSRRPPGGDPLVIAVYIGDSPEAVSHATRDRTIGHITRAVYDYFQLKAGG